MVISFFGHTDTPSTIKSLLEQTVQKLIDENKDITFLVGTHGAFDLMTQGVLKRASDCYPSIICCIVLSYIPIGENDKTYELPVLVPEGIEFALKRFAISFSNNYMVNECDTVVCYIDHDWGGAAQFVEKAKKRGKAIINLADYKGESLGESCP